MREDQFWCPKCKKRLQGTEVEKRDVDTMFGEGRWWFCPTCGTSVSLYSSVNSQTSRKDIDLHNVIAALGERALNSVWLGNGVDCYGANAEELCSFTDHEQPIAGHELFRITSGVSQTIEGDFKAFDLGSTSHWLYIRAWDGSGFYVETNDPQVKKHLKSQFQAVEEVEEAHHPYEGLFIPSNHSI